MASSHLTYDQASELIIDWYYDMKIELLDLKEPDWELESRSVSMNNNLNVAQKRKWLRESLKIEKEGSLGVTRRTIRGEIKWEISECKKKFVETKELFSTLDNENENIIYIARLLHIGARIVLILSSVKDSPNP